MKQTAVEWFQDQIIKIVNGTCELSEIQIYEQAKEMEKQQIKDAFIIGVNNGLHGYKTSEEYYKKTYKK